MRFQECNVRGAWLIEPTPHPDERGRFLRGWCRQTFAEHAIDFVPVQTNLGFSLRKGTVRGLHYQIPPTSEAKLVRCTRGSVFDVIVDLRPDSPTYGAWHGADLNADDGNSLYVPEGCAHGCQSLEDASEILYMTSACYSPEDARGVRYDDPAFGILWPLPVSMISTQDRSWPLVEGLSQRRT